MRSSPFYMARSPGTLRHLAFYRNRKVMFYYDEGQVKPWRFVFEDGVEVSSDPQPIWEWDDTPQLDLASAKAAALVLARKRYGGWAEENWDDWVDISEEQE